MPLLLALLGALLLAAGLYYRLRSPVPTAARVPTAQEAVPPPPTPPKTQPVTVEAGAKEVDLPSLDASDAFIGERLGALSADPSWPAWLSGDGLIRRWVAAVALVADGKSPHKVLDYLPVRGVFEVRTQGARTLIDESSYARYDGVARALASIDSAKTRSLWVLLHPLLQLAWNEIAPPTRELDAVVLAAIDHLLAAPLPPAEVELVLKDGLYRYVDPAYEALSPAQKHLERMGTQNMLKVREALRQLRPVSRAL